MIQAKKGLAYWQSQRDTLYDMYVNKNMSSVEIGKQYGVWGSTILVRLKKLGIPTKTVGGHSRPNSLYGLDDGYFDKIDTREKAYILGFVTSDGHISKKNTLMFSQEKGDIDVIEKIRKEFSSTHPIKIKYEKYACLNVTSKNMCDSLRRFGLTNEKTFGFNLGAMISNIPQKFEKDFLRGLFDGDGSIRIYKYPYFAKHTYHLGFTGTLEMCLYVKEKFDLQTKLADEGNGFFTVVTSCKDDIVRIGHFMYDDATIYMNRKKNTFDKVYSLVEQEA